MFVRSAAVLCCRVQPGTEAFACFSRGLLTFLVLSICCLLSALHPVYGLAPASSAVPAQRPGSEAVSTGLATSYGLGLLSPRLIAANQKDLWIGAAMEERFYHIGKFANNHFVPDGSQFEDIVNNCPYSTPDQCKISVGRSLNLSKLYEILYKLEGEVYRARLTVYNLGDSLSSQKFIIEGPKAKPIAFVNNIMAHIFEISDTTTVISRELRKYPTRNRAAYGCYALGFRYFIQRDLKQVFYPLFRAKQLDNTFFLADVLIAHAYLLTGKISLSYKILESIPIKSTVWQAELLKSEIALREGKGQKAFLALQKADELLSVKIADFEYAIANYYKEIAAPSRGISHAIAAINLNPSALKYHQLLGDLYARQGKSGTAKSYYEKLIQLDPGNMFYRLSLGIALRNSHNMGESIQIFQDLLKDHPDFFPARINLGIAYFQLGWYDKSAKIFQANIDLHQDTLESKLNLAILKIKTGDLKQGRKWLQEVLKKKPNSTRAMQNLGVLEMEIGNYGAAEDYLLKSLKLNETDTMTLINLSRIYSKTKRSDKEFSILNLILEMDPENASALTQLAEHSLRNNDTFEAINYLTEVIELNSGAFRQRLLLAKAFFSAGEAGEAEKQLAYVADNFTTSPEILLELAQAYIENRMFRQAIGVLESLIRRKSHLYRSHILLGQCYTEQIIQGQSRRVDANQLALDHLLMALEVNSSDWQVHYWLGRYQRSVNRDYTAAKKHLKLSRKLAPGSSSKAIIDEEFKILSM